ncbi:MAG: PLDc_N domain-containing protein [Ruminococcus sp.]|nr:PLDc_N domain-containing protein [Ruminococcus sp.]MBQ3937602.1 PLDc_N domain-containing protein [Ruminococcus sp.]
MNILAEIKSFEDIKEYLPLLIPIAVLQLGLMLAALISILKHKKYKTGNRALWVILSLFVSIIGPILYFVLGKTDEEE